MAISPLEIQKMRFRRRMRGYDPAEVESFLGLVAEEVAGRLTDAERREQELAHLRQQLADSERREHELQEILVRAQKVADSIEDQARREARLVVEEAETTADRMVGHAIEQATHIESRISELVLARRELHARLKSALELFGRLVEDDVEEERSTATVHVLNRSRRPRSE